MKNRILNRITVLLVLVILLFIVGISTVVDGGDYVFKESGKYIPILLLGFIGVLGPLLLIDFLLWRLVKNKKTVNIIGGIITILLLLWFVA